MSFYAEYAHGMMSDYEFEQCCIAENRRERIWEMEQMCKDFEPDCECCAHYIKDPDTGEYECEYLWCDFEEADE